MWAIGAGAELRQALGTAVFSGMIGVTFFGLIFTPVFYVTTRWLAGIVRAPAGNREPEPPASARSQPSRPARSKKIKAPCAPCVAASIGDATSLFQCRCVAAEAEFATCQRRRVRGDP